MGFGRYKRAGERQILQSKKGRENEVKGNTDSRL